MKTSMKFSAVSACHRIVFYLIIILLYALGFDKSLDGIFSAGNKYICTYRAG